MSILTWIRVSGPVAAFWFLSCDAALGQDDVVKAHAITSSLHQANLGKIAFTTKPIPVENLKDSDFLTIFELKDSADLTITAFMQTSLTNYLHRIAPHLSVDELTRIGNYQFSFFVDGALIHKFELSPAAISSESKNTKTSYSATFLSSANSESRWSATWHRFMLNGGDQALTEGKHLLRVELRPYLRTAQLKVGDLIASGELRLTVAKSKVDENLTAIQPIQPGSGWQISKDTFEKESIRELNRQIAQKFYKEIKSIVVIRDGKLLIEEYFNGADRSTLHNPRSAGKSFTSTMMGIAINDGHIKSEHQTLKDFYDLKQFDNYSPKKETVTIESLLTMSSGFDANDDDQNSPGNEEKMYPTADWVKFTLDLPMDDKSQVAEKWRYFTAGVVVLGDIIDKAVPGGLEKYADQKLFQPLGISKYQWPHTPQNVPNTAGGLKMNALDFAKYGQLYRNGGQWNGKQIIPRSWVDKTFTKHRPIPYGDNLSYGYLFWNTIYRVQDKPYEAFFATGNGGNKIFVFKDRPFVVVVTATAFGKWYMHQQIDSMMERYILPAIVR